MILAVLQATTTFHLTLIRHPVFSVMSFCSIFSDIHEDAKPQMGERALPQIALTFTKRQLKIYIFKCKKMILEQIVLIKSTKSLSTPYTKDLSNAFVVT